MYIKRLIEFAEANPKLFPAEGFQLKKIDWIVDIEMGSMNVTFNEAEEQKRIVPSVNRTREVRPALIVDRADYVFGKASKEKDQARSKIRQNTYLLLLEDYLSKTNDEDIKVLIEILHEEIPLPLSMKESDIISFRIRDEDYLHENEKVKHYILEELKNKNESTVDHQTKCMFCGQIEQILDVHTISFKVNRENTKLISANENAYESQGISKSKVAPTCHNCEQKYGKALEYFLQKKSIGNERNHVLRVGELNYVYWLHGDKMEGNVATTFQLLDKNNLQSLKTFIKQIFSGIKRDVEFEGLSILVLSANKGRLVVRDYFENKAITIINRIESFLNAQDIGEERLYNVFSLASATYQNTSQMKVSDLQDWFNWVFKGQPLPKRILVQLLKRIQSEGRMHKLYFAVLKSWLCSQKNGRDWTVKFDEENRNPAYIVGNIFALLEKVHQSARGSSTDSLSNKYFGSMSTTPKTVFAVLMKNYQHHLAKIADVNKGGAIYYDKKMITLLSSLQQMPTLFTLDEQAEFTLGYYHEKERLWTKKEEV